MFYVIIMTVVTFYGVVVITTFHDLAMVLAMQPVHRKALGGHINKMCFERLIVTFPLAGRLHCN